MTTGNEVTRVSVSVDCAAGEGAKVEVVISKDAPIEAVCGRGGVRDLINQLNETLDSLGNA